MGPTRESSALRRLVAVAALLALPCCVVDLPFEGTQFRCNETPPYCPKNQICQEGICQAIVAPDPDASAYLDGPDGTMGDGPGETTGDGPQDRSADTSADGAADLAIRDAPTDLGPDSWPDIATPPDPCQHSRFTMPPSPQLLLERQGDRVAITSPSLFTVTFDRAQGGCLSTVTDLEAGANEPLPLTLDTSLTLGNPAVPYSSCSGEGELTVEEQSPARIVVRQEGGLVGPGGEGLQATVERVWAIYPDGQAYVSATFTPDPGLVGPVNAKVQLLGQAEATASAGGYGPLVLPPGQEELFLSLPLPPWLALHASPGGQGAFVANLRLPGDFLNGVGLASPQDDRLTIYWTTGFNDTPPQAFVLHQLVQLKPNGPATECMDLWVQGFRRSLTPEATQACRAHLYDNEGSLEAIDRETGAVGVDYTGINRVPFFFTLPGDAQGYHNPILELHALPQGTSPRVAVEATPLSQPSYYSVLPQVAGQPSISGPWVVQLMVDALPGQYLHVRVDLL